MFICTGFYFDNYRLCDLCFLLCLCKVERQRWHCLSS